MKAGTILASLGALFLLSPVPSTGGSLLVGGEELAFFHGGGRSKRVLNDEERELAQRELGGLAGKVTLVLFVEKEGCRTCDEAGRFVEEVSALSPDVSHVTLDLAADGERAAELGIDKAPAMALLGASDPGIRYFGLPLGYEFKEFIMALGKVAEGRSGLKPSSAAALATVKKPVTLTVFVAET